MKKLHFLVFIFFWLLSLRGFAQSSTSNSSFTPPNISLDSFSRPASGAIFLQSNQASATSEVASGPLQVEVGIYVLDLANLDIKEKKFFADFYIWYKWRDNPQIPWQAGNVEFMNGNVEYASPISSDTYWDGKLWVGQRIKGTFRGRFNVRSYPFDSQTLNIVLEDSQYSSTKVRFIPDPANPDFNKWIESTVEVPDWKITGASVLPDVHEYETNFGDDNPKDPEKYSKFGRFSFQVNLHRLFVPHLVKFIIPLLVIAGMAYTVFFINAQEFQAQCGISVTALLTAVCMHISQADALPAVGYLVMSDKIFIIFYLAIFSSMVQTVAVNNFAKRGGKELARKLDVAFRYLYPAFLIIGCILIFMF